MKAPLHGMLIHLGAFMMTAPWLGKFTGFWHVEYPFWKGCKRPNAAWHCLYISCKRVVVGSTSRKVVYKFEKFDLFKRVAQAACFWGFQVLEERWLVALLKVPQLSVGAWPYLGKFVETLFTKPGAALAAANSCVDRSNIPKKGPLAAMTTTMP
jgi:hypothetical protein